jgi:hypothetical protein
MTPDEQKAIIAAIAENTRATNRTTRAIRAIARPIYIAYITALAIIPAILIGLASIEAGLIIGGIVLLASFIAALIAISDELGSSQIPVSSSPVAKQHLNLPKQKGVKAFTVKQKFK